MARRAQSLQAIYNRKREMENVRYQQTEALSNYYNHWDKVNSRFNNWTTENYYRKADAKMQNIKDTREKERTMHVRRHNLRTLFAQEKSLCDAEVREKEKSKSRRNRNFNENDETLTKIQQQLRDEENLKRRLDLESKLYGNWRHGVDNDNLLAESKTDNESLGKLNRFDKKLQDQTQRVKDLAADEERYVRMQEEIARTEEKERQEIRDKEIYELRTLQDRQIDELRERQNETDLLKNEEKKLRNAVDDVDKDLELLGESSAVVLEPASNARNIKKVKHYLRNRCDIYSNHIKVSIDILERMRKCTTEHDKIDELLKKYRKQYEIEKLSGQQIEAMYESEAKYNLTRFEEAWQTQLLDRYQEVKDMLKNEQNIQNAALNENLKRQTDIVEVRSTHLSSIENSNDKLKQLLKEQDDSLRPIVNHTSLEMMPNESPSQTSNIHNTIHASDPANSSLNKSNTNSMQTKSILSHSNDFSAPNYRPSRKLRPSVTFGPLPGSLTKVTSSFQNLNMDVWKEKPAPARCDIDEAALRLVTPDPVTRPMFGRKRIDWT